MTKKERALLAVERLKARYPEAHCSLEYRKPYELMVTVRLAAQCTDARVNQISGPLFARFPTLESLANAKLPELEEMVRSCGYHHQKAKNIIEASRMLLENYGGVMPDTMEELLKLPGVGRKSANLLLGDIYGKPAIVVDTHCMRITGRLGLVDSKDPYKVELQLLPLLPPEESNDFCHRLVYFGREICEARNPKCSICPLADICAYFHKTQNP